MGFSLGSLAGGAAQGLDPYLQMMAKQQQANQGQGLAGQALAGMNGVSVPAQAQSPLAGLMSKLGIGGAQPPVQNAPPQQAPAQQPAQQAQPQPQPPAQQAQPQPQPPAQQPQQGGGLIDALAQIESGNRNIPSQTDPDYAGQPGSKSQGFFQIDTPTWRQFASQVPGAAQYPNAMAAPREVQAQVASAIPAARFGPRTQQMLQQQYGTFDLHKTIGELNAQFQGVGRPGGGQPQGGQPQGQPPQAGQVQQMQLADIVQAMKRAKPDLTGVELMQAVGQILPIMNVQAQQQYHAVQQQLAQQGRDETVRRDNMLHEDRAAGLKEKHDEFGARQARYQLQADERKREFQEKMDLDLKKLQSADDRAGKAQHAAAVRAAISAKLRADKLQIDAANAFDDKEKASLKKIADQDAKEAQQRLDEALKQDRAPKEEKAPERAATPGAVGGYAPKPEAAPKPAAYKIGDTITAANGQPWRKVKDGDDADQGNWEPVNTAPPRAQ